jgi:hypothetical protein
MTARRSGTAARRSGVACLVAALFAGIGTLAGCGSTGSHAAASVSSASAATAPLATSMTSAGGGAWAIVAMGGSAAAENRFWELFTRPATGSGGWQLVTPPGVADNGGLVAADARGSVTVAFRPSQGLTFSPLALTSNGGKTWGTGLIDAPVASVPDAFAASADGGMLALLDDGAIDQAASASAGWTRLAAPGAITASPAGRQCEVTGLTGVSYTPSGAPLAAASCARPGVAGIFVRSGNTWAAAGPAIPGGQPVRVLRLVGTSASDGHGVGGDVALLQAGTGSTATLFVAWTSDGTHWTVSSPLSVGSQAVLASGTGPAGAVWVLLADGHAETVTSGAAGTSGTSGAAWRELPAPPAGTATLAAVPGVATVPGGTFDALVTSGGKLIVYQLAAAGGWAKTQVINVPIQYGSSS